MDISAIRGDILNRRAEDLLVGLKRIMTELRVMMYVNDTDNLLDGMERFNKLNASLYAVTDAMIKTNKIDLYIAVNKAQVKFRKKIDELLVPSLQRMFNGSIFVDSKYKTWVCAKCKNDNMECMRQCEKCQQERPRPTPGGDQTYDDVKSEEDGNDDNDDDNDDDNEDYYHVNGSKHTCE